MRALIQRVKYASVSSNDSLIGSIGIGLTVFIGIGRNDTIETANYIINKVLNLRLFSKEDNPLALSVDEIHGGLLIVSQFTLCVNTKKGHRPSFINAAPSEFAQKLYLETICHLHRKKQ